MELLDKIAWRVSQIVPDQTTLVYIRDSNRKFLYVNDVYCKTMGLTANQLIGGTGEKHLSPKYSHSQMIFETALLESGGSVILFESIAPSESDHEIKFISVKSVLEVNGCKYLVGVSIPTPDGEDSILEEIMAQLIFRVLRLVQSGVL